MIDLLLVVGSVLLSEQSPQNAPVLRQQIVVTAERGAEERDAIPAATTVLTREEIGAMAADDLGEVVDSLPGVTTFLEGPGTRPMLTVRGFFGGGEVEYLQLLVDGVPVGDPSSGLVSWSAIPAESIARLEFLRGPASALYGDVALGGVVEVFTTSPSDSQQSSIALETGSFDAHEVTASWRRNGPVAAALSAAASTTDGYRDHSASERLHTNGSVMVQTRTGTIGLRIGASATEREEPGLLPLSMVDVAPEASDEMFRFDREEFDLLRGSIDYSTHGRVPLHIIGWANDHSSSITRTTLLAAGFGDRLARDTDSRTFGTSLVATYESASARRPNTLRGGLELTRATLDTEYFGVSDTGSVAAPVADANGSRNAFAIFLADHLELSPQSRVTVGLRYDSIEDQFEERSSHRAWSPRIGLNVHLGSVEAPYVVFGQIARAFKAPTIDQLFDPRPYPDFLGGHFTISNSLLEPQRATNIEAGLSRSTAAARWELVGYRMHVRNEIDFDVTTFRYRNIGEALHRGVESSVEWRRMRFTPRISYAWTRVESVGDEYDGRQLKNIPEHTLELGARGALPAGVQLDAALRLLAEWYFDDANTAEMDESWQLDLRLRRRFGAWTGRLDILNALDQVVPHVGVVLPDFAGGEVVYAWPSTGRSLKVGIERSF